jgi:hypothetical protein
VEIKEDQVNENENLGLTSRKNNKMITTTGPRRTVLVDKSNLLAVRTRIYNDYLHIWNQ